MFFTAYKTCTNTPLPDPSTQFIKCLVGIMHLNKPSPVLWLHLSPLSPSNSVTYPPSQPAVVPFPMAPLFPKRGRPGNRKEITCCVYSAVQISVPASHGQGIKAPVMPCGERGHGSVFAALRPNVDCTCSEIKEPGEVHHLISSTTFLLCPFVKRGHQNICLLCWNMFMFRGNK